jgi:hypothetical protein
VPLTAAHSTTPARLFEQAVALNSTAGTALAPGRASAAIEVDASPPRSAAVAAQMIAILLIARDNAGMTAPSAFAFAKRRGKRGRQNELTF